MSAADLDARVRAVEQAQSTHEAVCGERYKAINLRLNVILAVMVAAVALISPPAARLLAAVAP